MKITKNQFLNIKGIQIYNKVINGYFTVDEAEKYAKSLNMRLPTSEEFELLIKEGCWQFMKNGAYLANSQSDLENPDRRITFSNYGYLDPASDYKTYYDMQHGFYWCSNKHSEEYQYSLIIQNNLESRYSLRISNFKNTYKQPIILVK